jgi:hypothetical protein
MENRKPVWSHKSVFDVTKEELDALFTSNEHTRNLDLQASSYVPLNGPVFKYLQTKALPKPIVGGSILAELDTVETRDDGFDKMIFRKSQIQADRMYYRLHPEKVAAWLPGGEKVKSRKYLQKEAAHLESEFGDQEYIPDQSDQNEFLENASSDAEPTGLLPDYEFLKTPEPPQESDLPTEYNPSTSPYYEEIVDETFDPVELPPYDEDLMYKPVEEKDLPDPNTKLLDAYSDAVKGKTALPSDTKIWTSKLDREDEY